MAKIKDLEQLDLSKVKPASLMESVKGIIEDYKGIKDKAAFENIEATNIDKIYQMITKASPDAIPSSPCSDPEEEESKAESKKKNRSDAAKEKESQKKSTSKEELKKIKEALDAEIKVCRLKIRKFNEKQREEKGVKPKPTRYAKIKSHMVSLSNLIPKSLKDDLEVQKESNKLLKSTHRNLLKIYKMTAIRGEKDHEELKDRFEKIEDKLETK